MDHYATLQVSRDAEPEVIEKAYKALCLKYHPDVVNQAERTSATRKMQRINVAYGVLKNSRSRQQYDKTLSFESAGSAWDVFLDKGLLGMLFDKLASDQHRA